MAEVKKVSVNTDEEALIKKRLLTQTTTARPGADPPVKKLTKKYVAYVNALAEDDANGDGADAERAREAWLKEIALYEFNMGRYRAVASANAREMEQYASASAAVVVMNLFMGGLLLIECFECFTCDASDLADVCPGVAIDRPALKRNHHALLRRRRQIIDMLYNQSVKKTHPHGSEFV